MNDKSLFAFTSALLIDCDETDLLINSILLRSNNLCNVIYTATTVEYALALLQTLSPKALPQIILLDIECAGKNSLDFMAIFEKFPKYITAGIKIYILSAELRHHEWLFPLQKKYTKHPYISRVIIKPLTLAKLMK